MTTTNSHAAPWTFRRFLAMFTPRRTTPNLLQTQAGTWSNTAVLTPREAVARHLFGESCNWDAAEMFDFDESPILRGGWLAEADRRIAIPVLDILVLTWHGYTTAEWSILPAHVKASKRDGYFQVRGL